VCGRFTKNYTWPQTHRTARLLRPLGLAKRTPISSTGTPVVRPLTEAWAFFERQLYFARAIDVVAKGLRIDAIIADYFSMLEAELNGQAYVKSRHSAALMERIGRTHRSVEFKHQNISAVLEELGLPRIAGYKPKRNYQGAIFGAIDRYLSQHNGIVNFTPSKSAAPDRDQEISVDRPALADQKDRPPDLEKLVRKFDPVERDRLNRSLGHAGEAFVLEIERKQFLKAERTDLAEGVRWISRDEGDGAGFDILSFDPSGRERLIEVKTTNGGARPPFFLSRNERHTAVARADSWVLYRVRLFSQTPRIFKITPPLEKALHLRTETWRASFS
jgi:Protein NO VEIN, C-terminal